MPTITINDTEFIYTLKYSKRRKTICLKVVGPHDIEITAPAGICNLNPEKLLFNKFNWLKKKANALQALAEAPLNKTACNGQPILFLGEPHILQVVHNSTLEYNVKRKGNNIIISLPTHPNVKHDCTTLLENWYKKTATNILIEKTRDWSFQMGVSPTKINIKDQRTRWGSCSSLGNINYNWRIVMAPIETIDYLVIHELAHLIVPNHSTDFWQVVQRHCPTFRNSCTWLKLNGQLLMRFLNKE